MLTKSKPFIDSIAASTESLDPQIMHFYDGITAETPLDSISDIIRFALKKNIGSDNFGMFCYAYGLDLSFVKNKSKLDSLILAILVQLPGSRDYQTEIPRIKKTIPENLEFQKQPTPQNSEILITNILTEYQLYYSNIDFVEINQEEISLNSFRGDVASTVFRKIQGGLNLNSLQDSITSTMTRALSISSEISLAFCLSGGVFGSLVQLKDRHKGNIEDYQFVIMNRLITGDILRYYVQALLKTVSPEDYINFVKKGILCILDANSIREIHSQFFGNRNYYFLMELVRLEDKLTAKTCDNILNLIKNTLPSMIIEQLIAAYDESFKDCKQLMEALSQKTENAQMNLAQNIQKQDLYLQKDAVADFKAAFIEFLTQPYYLEDGQIKEALLEKPSFEALCKALRNCPGFPKVSLKVMEYYAKDSRYRKLLTELHQIFPPQTIEQKYSGKYEIKGQHIVLNNMLLNKLANAAEILVFAEKVLLISGNLECPGVDLTLMGNTITVTSPSDINTSGKNGAGSVSNQKKHNHSIHGESGENGNPGQHAGDITIYCHHLNNGNNLSLTANGGNGANGTSGKPGKDGENGKNGKNGVAKEQDLHWLATSHTMAAGTDATAGTKGGDGGNAGWGGKAGNAGNITLTIGKNCFKTEVSLQQHLKATMVKGTDGQTGQPGKGGAASIGGMHGQDDSWTGSVMNWAFTKKQKKGYKLKLHADGPFYNPYSYKPRIKSKEFKKKSPQCFAKGGAAGGNGQKTNSYAPLEPAAKKRALCTQQLQSMANNKEKASNAVKLRLLNRAIAQQEQIVTENLAEKARLESNIAKFQEEYSHLEAVIQECNSLILQKNHQEKIQHNAHKVLSDLRQTSIQKDNTNLVLIWESGRKTNFSKQSSKEELLKLLRSELGIAFWLENLSYRNLKINPKERLKMIASYAVIPGQENNLTCIENILEYFSFIMHARDNKLGLIFNRLPSAIDGFLQHRLETVANSLASEISKVLNQPAHGRQPCCILADLLHKDDLSQESDNGTLIKYILAITNLLPTEKAVVLYERLLDLQNLQPSSLHPLARYIHNFSLRKKLTGIDTVKIIHANLSQLKETPAETLDVVNKFQKYDLKETSIYFHYFNRACEARHFVLDQVITAYNQDTSVKNFVQLIAVFSKEMAAFTRSSRGIYALTNNKLLNFIIHTKCIFLTMESAFSAKELQEIENSIYKIFASLENYSFVLSKIGEELTALLIMVKLQADILYQNRIFLRKSGAALLEKQANNNEESHGFFGKIWQLYNKSQNTSQNGKSTYSKVSGIQSEIKARYANIKSCLEENSTLSSKLKDFIEDMKDLLFKKLQNHPLKGHIEKFMEQMDFILYTNSIDLLKKLYILKKYVLRIAIFLEKSPDNESDFIDFVNKLPLLYEFIFELSNTSIDNNILLLIRNLTDTNNRKNADPYLFPLDFFAKKYSTEQLLAAGKYLSEYRISHGNEALCKALYVIISRKLFEKISRDYEEKQYRNNIYDFLIEVQADLDNISQTGIAFALIFESMTTRIHAITNKKYPDLALCKAEILFDVLEINNIVGTLDYSENNWIRVMLKHALTLFKTDKWEHIKKFNIFVISKIDSNFNEALIEYLEKIYAYLPLIQDTDVQESVRNGYVLWYKERVFKKYPTILENIQNKPPVYTQILQLLQDYNNNLLFLNRDKAYKELLSITATENDLEIFELDSLHTNLMKQAVHIPSFLLNQIRNQSNTRFPIIATEFNTNKDILHALRLVSETLTLFLQNNKDNYYWLSKSLEILNTLLIHQSPDLYILEQVFKQLKNNYIQLQPYLNDFQKLQEFLDLLITNCEDSIEYIFENFLQNEYQFTLDFTRQWDNKKQEIIGKVKQAILSNHKTANPEVMMDIINIHLEKHKMLTLVEEQIKPADIRQQNINMSVLKLEKSFLGSLQSYFSDTANAFISKSKALITDPVTAMKNKTAFHLCNLIISQMREEKALNIHFMDRHSQNALGEFPAIPLNPLELMAAFLNDYLCSSKTNSSDMKILVFYYKYLPILQETDPERDIFIKIIKDIDGKLQTENDIVMKALLLELQQHLIDSVEPKLDLMLESLRKSDRSWQVFNEETLEECKGEWNKGVSRIMLWYHSGIMSVHEIFICLKQIKSIFVDWFSIKYKGDSDYKSQINLYLNKMEQAKVLSLIKGTISSIDNSQAEKNYSVVDIFSLVCTFISTKNGFNESASEKILKILNVLTHNTHLFTPVENIEQFVVILKSIANIIEYISSHKNPSKTADKILAKSSAFIEDISQKFIQVIYRFFLEMKAELLSLNLIIQFNNHLRILTSNFSRCPYGKKNLDAIYFCMDSYLKSIFQYAAVKVSEAQEVELFKYLRLQSVQSFLSDNTSDFESSSWWLRLIHEFDNNTQLHIQNNFLKTHLISFLNIVEICQFESISLEESIQIIDAVLHYKKAVLAEISQNNCDNIQEIFDTIITRIKTGLIFPYLNLLNDFEKEFLVTFVDKHVDSQSWVKLMHALENIRTNTHLQSMNINRLIDEFVSKNAGEIALLSQDNECIHLSFFSTEDRLLITENCLVEINYNFMEEIINIQRFYSVNQWGFCVKNFLVRQYYQVFISLEKEKFISAINSMKKSLADNINIPASEVATLENLLKNLVECDEDDEYMECEILHSLKKIAVKTPKKISELELINKLASELIHFRHNFNRLISLIEPQYGLDTCLQFFYGIYKKIGNNSTKDMHTVYLSHVFFELTSKEPANAKMDIIHFSRPGNWLLYIVLLNVEPALHSLSAHLDKALKLQLIKDIKYSLSALSSSPQLLRLIAERINGESSLINMDCRIHLQAVSTLLEKIKDHDFQILYDLFCKEPLAQWENILTRLDLESELYAKGCENEPLLFKILSDLSRIEKKYAKELYDAFLQLLQNTQDIDWNDMGNMIDACARNEWQLDAIIIPKLQKKPFPEWKPFISLYHQNILETQKKPRDAEAILNLLTMETRDDVTNTQLSLTPEKRAYIRKQLEQIDNHHKKLDFTNIHDFKDWIARGMENFPRDETSILALVIYGFELVANTPLAPEPISIRPTQYIALLLFLSENPGSRGFLSQIATGEGKTLIIAMLAICRILLKDKQVFIITSSSDLAKDNVVATKKFYDAFDIHINTICGKDCDNNIDERKHRYDNNQIIYGDISSFQRDVLLTRFYKKNIVNSDKKPLSYIVDEVDSTLLDSLSRVLYLSHDINDLRYLRPVYVEIWAFLHSPDVVGLPQDKCVETIKSAIESRLNNGEIAIPAYLRKFASARLVLWIKSAFEATQMKDKDPYIVNKDIHVMDRDTGVEHHNMQLSNALHQFLQLKHGLPVTSESLKAVFSSILGFFTDSDHLLYGLTGTLGSNADRNFLKKVYNVDFFKMPRFKYRNFYEEAPVICSDKEDWLKTLSEGVIQKEQAKRAILILCANVRIAEKIESYLKKQTETESLPARESRMHLYVNDSQVLPLGSSDIPLQPGDIIVATTLASRGKDLESSEHLEKNGGLHVLLTFLPESTRGEEQILGRTARKGNKGSGQLMVMHPGSLELKALRDIRDEEETKRMEELRLTKVQTIQLEEMLLEKYMALYQQIETHLQKYKLSYKKDYITIQLKCLNDYWAFWLDSISEILKIPSLVDQTFLDKQFTVFEQEMLAISDRDDTILFAESPHQLVQLGIHFSVNLNKHSLSIKCLQKVIDEDPDFSALAHYYICYALIKKSKEHDGKLRSQVSQHLERAKTLFEGQITDLSLTAETFKIALQRREQLKFGSPVDKFSDQCFNEIKLLKTHVQSIDKALSHDVNLDMVLSTLIRLDSENNNKGKDLYENMLKDPEIILPTRLNKKVGLQDDLEQELYIDDGFEKRFIIFPTPFSYCKTSIIDFHRNHLTNLQKRSLEIPLTAKNYLPFVCDKQMFCKILQEHLGAEVTEQKITFDLPIQIVEEVVLPVLPTMLLPYKELIGLLIDNIENKNQEKLTISVELAKLPLADSLDEASEKLFYLLLSQGMILNTTFNVPFNDSVQAFETIQIKVKAIFSKIYAKEKKKPDSTKSMISETISTVIEAAKDLLKNDIDEKIQPLFDLISECAGKIKTLPTLDVSLHELESYFQDSDFPPEIYEFQKHFLDKILEFSEIHKFNWAILAIAVFGLSQIMAGVILETLSLGMGSPGCAILISEGIGDILYAMQCGANNQFSWKDYAKYKAFSLVITGCSFGVGSYFSTASKATNFAKPISRILLRTAEEAGLAVTKGLINHGLNKLLANLPHEIMLRFGESLEKWLFSDTKMKDIMEDIERNIQQAFLVNEHPQDAKEMLEILFEQALHKQFQKTTYRKTMEAILKIVADVPHQIGQTLAAQKTAPTSLGMIQIICNAISFLISKADEAMMLANAYELSNEVFTEFNLLLGEEVGKKWSQDKLHTENETMAKAFTTEFLGEKRKHLTSHVMAQVNEAAIKSTIMQGINYGMSQLQASIGEAIDIHTRVAGTYSLSIRERDETIFRQSAEQMDRKIRNDKEHNQKTKQLAEISTDIVTAAATGSRHGGHHRHGKHKREEGSRVYKTNEGEIVTGKSRNARHAKVKLPHKPGSSSETRADDNSRQNSNSHHRHKARHAHGGSHARNRADRRHAQVRPNIGIRGQHRREALSPVSQTNTATNFIVTSVSSLTQAIIIDKQDAKIAQLNYQGYCHKLAILKERLHMIKMHKMHMEKSVNFQKDHENSEIGKNKNLAEEILENEISILETRKEFHEETWKLSFFKGLAGETPQAYMPEFMEILHEMKLSTSMPSDDLKIFFETLLKKYEQKCIQYFPEELSRLHYLLASLDNCVESHRGFEIKLNKLQATKEAIRQGVLPNNFFLGSVNTLILNLKKENNIMSTTKREAAKSDNNERRVTLPNNGTQNANLLGNMDWLQMNPFGSQANQPSFMNKPTALQTRPNSPGQQAAPSSSQQGDSWQAMVGAGINAISTLAAAEEKTQRQKIILEQHKTNLEIAKQIGRNQEQAGKDTLKMQTEQHAYEAGENEKNRVLKREGMAQKKEIATQQIGIEKSKLEIEKDKLDFSMQQLISKEKRHHAQIESEERRHDKQLDHQMQIRTMELQAQVMASAANNSTSNPSSAPKKDDSVLQSADKAYKKGKKAFEKNETRDALRFFSQAKSLYQNANNDPEAQKRVAKIDGFTAALKV